MSHKKRHTWTRDARQSMSVIDSETLTPSRAAHRVDRLQQIILLEVQSLIRDEASDPALSGITLLSLELSRDGGHARIAYAVVSAIDQESVARGRADAALKRATGFLRARLATQLQLKKVPQLGFTFVGLSRSES